MAMENIVLNKFYGCVDGWNEFQKITAEGLLQAEAGFVRCEDDYIDGILHNWQRHDLDLVKMPSILAAVPMGLFFTDPDRALEVTYSFANRLGKSFYTHLSYSVIAYLTAVLVQRKPKTILAALKRSLLVVCSFYLHKGFKKDKLQGYIDAVYEAAWHNDYGLFKVTKDKEMLLFADALRIAGNPDNIYQNKLQMEETKCLADAIVGAFNGLIDQESLGEIEMNISSNLKELADDLFYKEPYPEDYAELEKWKKKYLTA